MSVISVDERILWVGIARVTDGALLSSIFVDSKLGSPEKQGFERQFLTVCQQQRAASQSEFSEFRTQLSLEYDP